MSNKKKPKKLRSPNVPSIMNTSASGLPAQARGGGQEQASLARQMRVAPAAATAQANFDYTYVKKDLGRIAILAGSFVAVLIVLSFFIK
jgi:hypothetical protein